NVANAFLQNKLFQKILTTQLEKFIPSQQFIKTRQLLYAALVVVINISKIENDIIRKQLCETKIMKACFDQFISPFLPSLIRNQFLIMFCELTQQSEECCHHLINECKILEEGLKI